MAQVGIVMGSDSDLSVMSKAAEILDEFGISYEMHIISAHREPDIFFEWAKGAEERGIKVIVAGAGMAAHLPGMCAALFPMPVIGIPMHTTSLGGRDSLYSIVQMPSGIPVATVAIGGGKNAGILAAKILAVSDPVLLEKLKQYSANMAAEVEAKDKRLQAKIGIVIKIWKVGTFIVAETTSSCITGLEPEFRLCHGILTIEPFFLDGVGLHLTVDGEISCNHRTVRAKTRKGNDILTDPHLLSRIVSEQILTINGPLCIYRSRSRTGNDVAILAISIVVNSN